MGDAVPRDCGYMANLTDCPVCVTTWICLPCPLRSDRPSLPPIRTSTSGRPMFTAVESSVLGHGPRPVFPMSPYPFILHLLDRFHAAPDVELLSINLPSLTARQPRGSVPLRYPSLLQFIRFIAQYLPEGLGTLPLQG